MIGKRRVPGRLVLDGVRQRPERVRARLRRGRRQLRRGLVTQHDLFLQRRQRGDVAADGEHRAVHARAVSYVHRRVDAAELKEVLEHRPRSRRVLDVQLARGV